MTRGQLRELQCFRVSYNLYGTFSRIETPSIKGYPIPTLFLMYIDGLLQQLVRVQEVNCSAFEDDLILWLVESFCDGIFHHNLQRVL